MQYISKGVLLENTFIIGDLHVGMEASLKRQGVLIPSQQWEKMRYEIEQVLSQYKPKKVILNGDVKDAFGRIHDQEWREVLQIIDTITKHAELVLVKGNHDPITPVIANKRALPVADYAVVNKTFICHGDMIPDAITSCERVIISHVHPALTLRDGAKYETYKCYLETTWHNKTLIVLPSFSTLTEGTDVTKERVFSPFLEDTKEARATIIYDNELYDFGIVQLA